ncbi:MAG: cation:proton antiporter [Phycisphaerales bacterium]|nr:MAG: cation:proton antiporter [Phycisphaerales bacterium]
MNPVWVLVIAFVLGFAARQVRLPPLVGFLIAGFVLHGFGVEETQVLRTISDLGVTLLLFTIGLKLRLASLLRPEIWAGATIHMLITVAVFAAAMLGLGLTGLSLFAGLDWRLSLLVAFALSFSSTVFAVKVLEEKAEMASLHGRVAIGILIMQDVIAVVFLAASQGMLPSPWALALVALIPFRYLIMKVLDRCGHGELLILFGMFLAVAGYEAFHVVRLKGDLGALVLGVLLASHPKAGELANSLLGFKDLFLIGFFLTIGLSGAPTLELVGLAALLAVAVPFKVALYFLLLTRFKLRVRTSLLASLSLANYSEFGLIVGAVAASNGWIGNEWLIIIAIALSITFILASPVNSAAHALEARFSQSLKRFETKVRRPDDQPLDPGDAQFVIFGMGRIGGGAYDVMRGRYGDIVIGVDFDIGVVQCNREVGRNVIVGDATDPDFWARVAPGPRKIRLVMLAMPNYAENMFAARRLAASHYGGLVAATAQYPDQMAELRKEGVDAVFNLFAEAGAGFANHVCERFKDELSG